MLNIEYKIVANDFAERLKSILPSIIKTDQKAIIIGRQISDHIRFTNGIPIKSTIMTVHRMERICTPLI